MVDRRELICGLEDIAKKAEERSFLLQRIQNCIEEENSLNNCKNDISVVKLSCNSSKQILKKASTRSDVAVVIIKIAVCILAALIVYAFGAGFITQAQSVSNNQLIDEYTLLIAISYIMVVVAVILLLNAPGCLMVALGIVGILGVISCTALLIEICGSLVWLFHIPAIIACAAVLFCLFNEGWQEKLEKIICENVKQGKEYQAAKRNDDTNRQENDRRILEARQNKSEQIQSRIAEIRKRKETYKAELTALENSLRNNALLPYDDVPRAARILSKIKNMRADSIKEALLQCDQESKE